MSYDANAPQVSPNQPGNGMGIASLVLGILSLIGCGFIAGIPGIIAGYLALKTEGRTMGIVGIILSVISTVLTLILLIFYIVVLFNVPMD